VKVQYFGDPEDLAKRRGLGPEYAAAYRAYNLPDSWLAMLADLAHAIGLRFIATAFRPIDYAVIAAYADDLKVSSFEADDHDVLAAAMASRSATQRLLVSCGRGVSPHDVMTRLREIERPLARVILLHCVSAYPAPTDDLNLARLRALENYDDEQIFLGYSDHSDPYLTEIGALAVAAGARLLEVHLRLDATPRDNPDFPHSRNPAQFAAYVSAVRLAERALGTGDEGPRPSEAPFVREPEHRLDVDHG
jgi:N-acetylneuraminate synthase/N,N'-diacetyllegionaminate synthase